MRSIFFFALLLLSATAQAQWVKLTVNTTASFRGLSVVSDKVIWASGTGGTVIRTIDGGKTWDVIQVPDAAKLDFRDIEAFDDKVAYILSIGNGESSRIYKTTDGGKTWDLQFKNTNEKAFFDAIACWDRKTCWAMSDPVNNKFLLIYTTEGNEWKEDDNLTGPEAVEGEAAFAASGTCLITVPGKSFPVKNNRTISFGGTAFMVTGGQTARVFRRPPMVHSDSYKWVATETTIIKGSAGSGIFSIAMIDEKTGIIVGGNYEKPNEAKDNLAFSSDGGKTWKLGTGLSGYRSGVTYIDKTTIIAVGTNGSDITRDGGKTWNVLGKEDLNAVAAKGKKAIWAVGPKGMVVKMK